MEVEVVLSVPECVCHLEKKGEEEFYQAAAGVTLPQLPFLRYPGCQVEKITKSRCIHVYCSGTISRYTTRCITSKFLIENATQPLFQGYKTKTTTGKFQALTQTLLLLCTQVPDCLTANLLPSCPDPNRNPCQVAPREIRKISPRLGEKWVTGEKPPSKQKNASIFISTP